MDHANALSELESFRVSQDSRYLPATDNLTQDLKIDVNQTLKNGQLIDEFKHTAPDMERLRN